MVLLVLTLWISESDIQLSGQIRYVPKIREYLIRIVIVIAFITDIVL